MCIRDRCNKALEKASISNMAVWNAKKGAFKDNLVIWNTLGLIQMASIEIKRYTKVLSSDVDEWIIYNAIKSVYIITAKPKAHAFKNEMCFPLTKTKCELKKHPNSKFECFFNDFNRTKTSLFLPFPSKLIQDNLVCVLELQE